MDQDLNYLYNHGQLPGEKICESINCINEGNPFEGTLILTNKRVCFVCGGSFGRQLDYYRLSNILDVTMHIENGFNYIAVLHFLTFEHRFELLGQDGPAKEHFVRSLKAAIEKLQKFHPNPANDSRMEGKST